MQKLQKFKNCLKSWQHRKLTLIGKNTVLKTFALPKLIYTLTVLPNPPNDIIEDIKSEIFNFIWDGKPDKIKRTQLIQSVENGGIRLTDIDSFLNAIKCSWVKRYLDNTNTSKWKLFYQKILKTYGDTLLFECNIDNNILDEISTKNKFLSNVLTAWCKVTRNLETKLNNKIILWSNKDITTNNKTFFYQNWFERNIKYVDQLYDYRINDFYFFDILCYIF